MKRTLTTLAITAGLLFAATPAVADGEWNYKNPRNPTKDASKLKDSQYRGFHYEKKYEGFRKCVMARESGGSYKIDGRWGSGAYQFVQTSWDTAMERAKMPEWIGVRPHKAPPYVQDHGFWIMANPYPKKKGLHGRHHWSSAHAAKFGFKTYDC
jgi:hypothetical protein